MIALRAGDTLSFVVDLRDGLNNDQFLWAPKIAAVSSGGAGAEAESQTWDAREDFADSSEMALTVWEQLAQTLLLTNEFVFLD